MNQSFGTERADGAPKRPVTLSRAQWYMEQVKAVASNGSVRLLDDDHSAFTVEGGRTLLVTFEAMDTLFSRDRGADPLAFSMADNQGWSSLCLLAHRATWYRSTAVYAFFDQLVDTDYFDAFDQIIFYGAGMCGYAACAFSVAAPGSVVVALHPQATLNPRIAGWDSRFLNARRLSFSDRYGFGPEMIEAARKADLLFNPEDQYDSMHAALLSKSMVETFRLPGLSGQLDLHLQRMKFIQTLLVLAADDRLDAQSFAAIYQARKYYRPYLRRLLTKTQEADRHALAAIVRRYALSTVGGRHFRKAAEAVEMSRSMPELDQEFET